MIKKQKDPKQTLFAQEILVECLDLLRHEISSHTCVRQENSQWPNYFGNKGCYVIKYCPDKQKQSLVRYFCIIYMGYRGSRKCSIFSNDVQ